MEMILFTFGSLAALIVIVILGLVAGYLFRNNRALNEKMLFLLTLVYIIGLEFFMIRI